MTRSLILIILFIIPSFLNSNDKLKVVFPKDFPPSYVLKNQKTTGYAIELFKEIEKDLNLNVEYIQKDNWNEVINMMKENQVDIIPNQGITEDRKKYMNFSNEVQSITISVYSFTGNKILGIDSLKENSVAVIKTNIANKILQKYKNIDLKVYDNKEHLFDDFQKGYIKFIAYSEPDILIMAKNRNFSKKIEKSFDLKIIHRAIGVNKNNPELLEKINISLNKLKNSGKLDEIYNKWHKDEKKYTIIDIFKIFGYLSFLPILVFFYLKYKKIIITKNELEEEVKRQTQLLSENYQKLEFATNKALNGYWEWNLHSNEIKCSEGWYKTLELDKNEFKPTLESIFELIHEDDKDLNKKAIKRILDNSNENFSLEFRFMINKEKYIWVHALGTVYENIKNEKVFFGFLLDINTTKQLEKQKMEQENMLFHQSKMAAMGEMLENIAHQWRQPLSMISTSATGIEFQKEINVLEDRYLLEAMKNINDATQYLSTTIDDFRNYFSSNKIVGELDVKEVINRVIRLISSKFKNREINIILNCNEKEMISNLENELIQVLINVLNNAKDALEEIDIEKKYIFIDSYKEEDSIIIKVKDNAGGIKKELLQKIFEPYFTTKYKKQGTGLGLFMCIEILNKHMNGDICVDNIEYEYENKVYKGAEFTVTIKNL